MLDCRILTPLAVAALLAACTSGEPTPRATPSTLPTSTHSTAPTSPEPSRTGPLTTGPNVRPGEHPPELPALARRHTANGALAFAAYYYRAFDWGYATNDPYLVARISADGCDGCRKYINGLLSLDRTGGVLHGGRVEILGRRLGHGQFRYASDYVVRVVLNEEAVVIDRPARPRMLVAPAVMNYVQFVFVTWQGGTWKVVEVAGD